MTTNSVPPTRGIDRDGAIEVVVVLALAFGWAVWSSTEWVLQVVNNEGYLPIQDRLSLDRLADLVRIELFLFIVIGLILLWRGWSFGAFPVRFHIAVLVLGVGLFVLEGVFHAGVINPLLDLLEPFLWSWPETATGTSETQGAASFNTAWPQLALVSVVNGWFEEIFLLGYMFAARDRYAPTLPLAWVAVASLLLRTSFHLYQGPVGALSILAFGGFYTAYYLIQGRRDVGPVIVAHALTDFVGLTILTTDVGAALQESAT